VSSRLTIGDKYVLLRRLGKGGMAEVFLAKQLGTGGFEKLVVLKRTLPEYRNDARFRAMFLEEARCAADLRHPNVVDVLEVGEDTGQLYIAMEFLHGQNVMQIIERHRKRADRLPIAHALQIVIDAACGLHYAHTKHDLGGRAMHLVHRDVSPQNIVATYDGETKLVDFGIAKAFGRSFETRAGTVKGKACYMSPEQVRGDALDHRSDQFALGIVLYELLTGRRLFRRRTEPEVLTSILEDAVPPLAGAVPGFDTLLEAIVRRPLNKSPESRFSDCGAFALALESYLDGQGIAHGGKRLGRYLRRFFADEIEDDRTLGHARLGLSPLPASPEAETRAVQPPIGADEPPDPTATGRDRTVGHIVTAEQPFRSDASTELHGAAIPLASTNVIAPSGTLIGRDDELAHIHRRFEQGARVITLIGPGGVGKSRVALEYANRHLGDYTRQGGAWHVDLEHVRTASEIVVAVAQVLGADVAGSGALGERNQQVAAALAARGRTLLVLDPFEHLTALFDSTVQAWLAAAPGLRLLVTSESPLRLPGESAIELAPLPIPSPDAPAAAILGSQAVRMLLETARSIDPDYPAEPAAADVPMLARIARLLEGTPLALQLAAARLVEKTPSFVLGELSRPGADLGLHDTIAWSWSLLDGDARDCVMQLSVFSGGCDLAAAEAIVELRDRAPPIARVLDRLRDRSLLRVYEPRGLRGDQRFSLSRPVSVLAGKMLDLSGMRDEVELRHADFYTRRCADWARNIDGPGGVRLLLRLSLERQNLLAIAARSLQETEPSADGATRALTALLDADQALVATADAGHAARLTRAIDMAMEAAVDVSLIARALEARADARKRMGELESADGDFQGALDLARAQGDLWFEGVVLRNLSELRDEPEEAEQDARVAIDIFRRLGDRSMEGRALLSLARRRREAGAYDAAQRHATAALDIFRHVGDRRFEGRASGELARLAVARGKPKGARVLFSTALSIAREMGEPKQGGEVLLDLGRVYARLADTRAARSSLEKARDVFQRIGQESGVHDVEEELAKLKS